MKQNQTEQMTQKTPTTLQKNLRLEKDLFFSMCMIVFSSLAEEKN